ncbi:MAG: single-stranded DNA-binding protein [Victivallaceae bacterium]
MASLNKVFLLGNLTREPDLRYTPGGAAVCEFGLAVNRKFISNNQEKEEVCFVEIVVWGKQAESCGRYLEKGSTALIEGRLQLDQWEDKDSGSKRSRLRIVADRVQFVGRKTGSEPAYEQNQDGAHHQPSAYQPRPPQQPYAQQQKPPAAAPQGRPFPPMPEDAFNNVDEVEDDIPF